MKKILFCGWLRTGLEAYCKLLLRFPQECVLVCTIDDEKRNGEFLEFLRATGASYTTTHVNNAAAHLQAFHPDYLLSIYYPHIISDEVLATVGYRAINLHPALLPRYRGVFSAPWVIINGETETGVTYHYMRKKVDTGNIILQKKLDIDACDTAFSLYHKLVTLGLNHFDEAVDLLLADVVGTAQPILKGELYKRGVPFGGYIDLNWNMEKIDRFIRALYFPPFTGALLRHNDQDVEFTSMEDFTRFARQHHLTLTS